MGVRLAVSFAAGFASVITPCVLPLVPGYLSAISSVEAGRLGERGTMRRVVVGSVPFILGFTVVFVVGLGSVVWLADALRLSKGGFAYWWRSHLDSVWNHHVHGPVRFWSHDGPDEDVLRALAERRFDDLPRLAPTLQDQQQQLADELPAALAHLRAVHSAYWDPHWRRDHRSPGRYPEHHLWEAVQG